jgi:hypothetical protein
MVAEWSGFRGEMMYKQVQWVPVCLGIVSIAIALLYELIIGQAATNPTAMITAICIISLLLLLSPNVDGLKSLSVGKESFRAELEVIQRKTSENERAITDLSLLSMGDDAYLNLCKLATGNFGKYKKERNMGLETELIHLRNLGHVVLNTEMARSIVEIPESGDQLSDYFKVTQAGKKYIALREKLA